MKKTETQPAYTSYVRAGIMVSAVLGTVLMVAVTVTLAVPYMVWVGQHRESMEAEADRATAYAKQSKLAAWCAMNPDLAEYEAACEEYVVKAPEQECTLIASSGGERSYVCRTKDYHTDGGTVGTVDT